MHAEYHPYTLNRIVLRVLQIPEQFRGKTLYGEGETMPFRPIRPFPVRELVDVLIRQSPSVATHIDQSESSTK
jgi:hypothetical protein